MTMHRFLFAASLLATACHCQAPLLAVADCVDPTKIKPQGICTMEYAPVCGCDGKTYANACAASNAGVRTYTSGPCAGTSK